MRHPTENETPDAIDAELPESKTLTPGAAKPQIRNPKSERTTAEKMRAECAVVGKKGSSEASRLRRSPQTN